MARLLFAADLSLGSLDCSKSVDPEMNLGFVKNDAFVVKECDSLTHCKQGPGKESQPADFVDYLGALPVLETSNGTSSVGSDPANSPESVSSQLTLFYAGTVNVFENVTADKAQLIMSLAGCNNSSREAMETIDLTTKGPDTAFMQPSFTSSLGVQNPLQKMQSKAPEIHSVAANSERLQVTKEGQAHEFADFLVPCQAIVPKALPLARKESLARFLERRKERVRRKAPYPGKGSQGVGCSKESTQMLYKRLWAAASMYTRGFYTELVDGNCVYAEQLDWAISYENSKQLSEGESAT